MWHLLSRIFRPMLRLGHIRQPAVPDGMRLYAIGDIHGRVDLLGDLLGRIDRDSGARGPATVRMILIGDLIDRGPGSATLLRDLSTRMPPGLICLRGNHEAAMVDAWKGDRAALRLWLAHGGRATLAGFDAAIAGLADDDEDALLDALVRHVPRNVIDWLRRLPLTYASGDYLFVHAGVRPGIPLARQTADDLLWIRDPFLTSDAWHGKVIVHGHTPSDDVEILPNRIGIDTGAYYSGRLSAIGLEGVARWVVQT
jgi:serine/threonine protein phosphatase 1